MFKKLCFIAGTVLFAVGTLFLYLLFHQYLHETWDIKDAISVFVFYFMFSAAMLLGIWMAGVPIAFPAHDEKKIRILLWVLFVLFANVYSVYLFAAFIIKGGVGEIFPKQQAASSATRRTATRASSAPAYNPSDRRKKPDRSAFEYGLRDICNEFSYSSLTALYRENSFRLSVVGASVKVGEVTMRVDWYSDPCITIYIPYRVDYASGADMDYVQGELNRIANYSPEYIYNALSSYIDSQRKIMQGLDGSWTYYYEVRFE